MCFIIIIRTAILEFIITPSDASVPITPICSNKNKHQVTNLESPNMQKVNVEILHSTIILRIL
jgi:hypothetical protein